MSSTAKQFTTSALVQAAGCNPVTFRAWRNRNGLFPETAGGQGWNRFSILDVCIVRTIVVLTEHGISARDAIWFAQDGHLGTVLRSVIDDYGMSPIIGFGRAPGEERPYFMTFLDPEEAVASLLDRARGIVTLLDLRLVVEHVCDGLGLSQSG